MAACGVLGVRRATRVQARLIKGIQKPRPEFETVGACLIMLHGISDAGANFECWYVEFLGVSSKQRILSVGMLNFWGIRSSTGSKHECKTKPQTLGCLACTRVVACGFVA